MDYTFLTSRPPWDNRVSRKTARNETICSGGTS